MKILGNVSAYEKKQFAEIIKWQNKKPSVASSAVGYAMKPVEWLVQKIVPQKAIQGALVASNMLAENLTDMNDITRDGGVKCISELRHKDLKLSDDLANEVHNWANGIATTEGGAAGFFGVAGMVMDIPTLITLSLRTIHKIGLCYGYECNTEKDRQFVYAIMSAAGANTISEKAISVVTLQSLNVMIAKTTWKKMAEKAATNAVGKEAGAIAIKGLAKQLGINITKRKAAQAIPVVGGLIGAAMNLAFMDDISWAARRSFQERWLLENRKIIS